MLVGVAFLIFAVLVGVLSVSVALAALVVGLGLIVLATIQGDRRL